MKFKFLLVLILLVLIIPIVHGATQGSGDTNGGECSNVTSAYVIYDNSSQGTLNVTQHNPPYEVRTGAWDDIEMAYSTNYTIFPNTKSFSARQRAGNAFAFRTYNS